MKKGFRMVIAKVARVFAVVLMVIGVIVLIPCFIMAFYAIFTHIHQGMVVMSDSARLFYLGWMLLGAAPAAIGGSLLLWAENILQRIRWANEVKQR